MDYLTHRTEIKVSDTFCDTAEKKSTVKREFFNKWTGMIGELRIWSCERSPTDIKSNLSRNSILGNEQNLIGSFLFIEYQIGNVARQ